MKHFGRIAGVFRRVRSSRRTAGYSQCLLRRLLRVAPNAMACAARHRQPREGLRLQTCSLEPLAGLLWVPGISRIFVDVSAYGSLKDYSMLHVRIDLVSLESPAAPQDRHSGTRILAEGLSCAVDCRRVASRVRIRTRTSTAGICWGTECRLQEYGFA